MKIHLNTDNHISASDGLSERVDRVVGGALERFADRLTRVEAHLSDVNSHKTGDGVDKRCMLEARVAGHQPIAVTEDAETVDQAISGAAQKLKRSLDSMFGKLDRRPEKAPPAPNAAVMPEDD
jgi:ribosome-associated translation inhibitor RaiA